MTPCDPVPDTRRSKAEGVPTRKELIDAEAWRLHRENGHPKGYDGPCWGPTMDESEHAQSTVKEQG